MTDRGRTAQETALAALRPAHSVLLACSASSVYQRQSAMQWEQSHWHSVTAPLTGLPKDRSEASLGTQSCNPVCKSAVHLGSQPVNIGKSPVLISRNVQRFPPGRAKFDTAEVLLALDFLHRKGVVFGDPRPENIVLDSEGHVQLTELGFAVDIGKGETNTLSGTPEYLAPELLQQDGHGISADRYVRSCGSQSSDVLR